MRTRGKRVAHLPKVYIRIGSSNPTQLLGKEQEVSNSGIDVLLFVRDFAHQESTMHN